MLKIKICGITNVADALLASEEGADFIGLIFAPSSRQVDINTAKEIVSEMPEGVVPVGVFQDQPAEEVREILTTCGIKFAQLHGNESVDYAASLGSYVIKAFDSYTDQTLETLRTYDTYASLLDIPKGNLGRSSVDVHWATCAKKYGRVILAGGLTPDRVQDLVRRVRPYGVDVCSFIERFPGKKDRSKLHDFVQAAREAEQRTTSFRVNIR